MLNLRGWKMVFDGGEDVDVTMPRACDTRRYREAGTPHLQTKPYLVRYRKRAASATSIERIVIFCDTRRDGHDVPEPRAQPHQYRISCPCPLYPAVGNGTTRASSLFVFVGADVANLCHIASSRPTLML